MINWCPHVGQEALGRGCEHGGEMGIGWGVLSWTTIGVDKVEGGKGSTWGIGKMPHICMKG
jgi:hypothetical protein